MDKFISGEPAPPPCMQEFLHPTAPRTPVGPDLVYEAPCFKPAHPVDVFVMGQCVACVFIWLRAST